MTHFGKKNAYFQKLEEKSRPCIDFICYTCRLCRLSHYCIPLYLFAVMNTALGHIYTFEIFQILINGGDRNKRSWLFKKSKINKRPPRLIRTKEYTHTKQYEMKTYTSQRLAKVFSSHTQKDSTQYDRNIHAYTH